MTGKTALGRRGEALCADMYLKQGAQILAANYTVRGGEIDVIAQKDDVVIFIEVKLRSSLRHGTPAEAVTTAKQKRICRTAQQFLYENGLTDAPVRFDVCEILNTDPPQITAIENAFDYAADESFF